MGLLISNPSRGRLLDRLGQLAGRSRDLRPLVPRVRQTILDANKERALRGVDWEGKPYARLAPATLADRRRKGYPPGPPLVRQGLAARVIAACEVSVIPRGDNSLTFTKGWPEVPWMEFHITGTPRMPRRDPLGFGQDELARVRALLPRWVISGRTT